MPIGAITMILTNVGLQIYNNWCSSRQNARLQQKREEFERAARERNTRRMWQIMREGQELTKALEEDRHRQRIDELKNDIGSLLQKLAYTATINNWPLNVLPIVMKNQALGNILANQEESIALHCIFTPSNSNDFNKVAFPRIEEVLETYCNQHWSVISEHPILFYGGAWKSAQSPTEVQIDSMRTALSNLPVLVISPFFRPNDGKLVFQIRLWGVGASSTDEFSIPEIEPTEFQRNFKIDDDYVNESEIIDELIEDIVPYLQCLIGYMADTYFWSSQGKSPLLPSLVTNGSINTDGMKYLIDNSREYYNKLLLTSKEKVKESPFLQENLFCLYDGSYLLLDKNNRSLLLDDIFLSCCENLYGERCDSVLDSIRKCPLDRKALSLISNYLCLSRNREVAKSICELSAFKDIYAVSENGYTIIPVIDFIEHAKFNDDLFIKLNVENYDILDTIAEFKMFVEENKFRIPINDPSLYIETKGYSIYVFHACDPDSHKILTTAAGFDYIIKCNKAKHLKQIKCIFRYSEHASLICRFSKIDKLESTINNNSLIY